MDVNEFLKATFTARRSTRSRATLADGTVISIQASAYHYCTPRQDGATHYSTVEIGYPPASFDGIASYEEPQKTGVYGFVPVELVDKFVAEHGGFV